MGVAAGPSFNNDGLVFLVDAANPASNMRSKQSSNILPDPHDWPVGTGGTTGYGANGDAAEQSRAVRTDPYGSNSVTWRSVPDAVSGADGGWNSSYYGIDTNFTYRWSVWCKRYTAGVGGTFYLGMNPAPIRNDNNTVQGNPYWYCPAISGMVQDRWYLIVGHCFYEGYSEGTRHPDSGWWYINPTNNQLVKDDIGFCNCGSQDVRWNPGTTTSMHRSYHYYTTNTASGIEWAFPRLDKLDGTQPSLADLIYTGESTWRDLSGNNHDLITGPGYAVSYNSAAGGVLNFAQNADGYARNTSLNLSSSNNTVISWVRKNVVGGSGRTITALNNNWLLAHHDTTYGDYYAEGWVNNVGSPPSDTTWRMYTGTGDIGTDTWQAYINDQLVVQNNAGAQGPNGWNINSQYSQFSDCQIGLIMAFNRVLSADEIKNIYHIYRKRFGV